MRARLLLIVCASTTTRVLGAAPLGVEPSLSLASEYSSNPYLSTTAHAKADAALIVNAPFGYERDGAHFSLTPAARYSSAGTYSALNSSYLHINGAAIFQRETDTLNVNAGFGRDSSLYQNGVGVRADATSAGAEWQHVFTPRLIVATDLSWQREHYNRGVESVGLTDYRYRSEGVSMSYAIDERTTAQLIGGAGQYQATNGFTASKDLNLQTGAQRALSELWILTATVGYSRSNNIENIYFGPYLLGKIESRQKGAVYNANITRQGETLTLTGMASRAFKPTGFAFLSKQDVAEFRANVALTERWGLAAKANYNRIDYPISARGGTAQLQFISAELSADWRWTERWVLSAHGTWVQQRYQIPPLGAQATGFSLQLTRQFQRIDLQ